MKKIFRKAFALIAIATMGIGVTSCDSETIAQLLPAILQMLMGGQAQTYSGSAQLEGATIYEYDEDGVAQCILMDSDSIKTVKDFQVSVQVHQNLATITIPSLEIGGRVLTNIQTEITINDGVLEGGYIWAYSCSRQFGNEQEQITVTEQNQDTYNFYLVEGAIKSSSETSAVFTFDAYIFMGTERYGIKYNGIIVNSQQ